MCKRGEGDSAEFKVRWEGYREDADQWLPRSSLLGAADALADFENAAGAEPAEASARRDGHWTPDANDWQLWCRLGVGTDHKLSADGKHVLIQKYVTFLRTEGILRPLTDRTATSYGRIVNALTEPNGRDIYGLKRSPSLALLTKASLDFSPSKMKSKSMPYTRLCRLIRARPHNRKAGHPPSAAVRALETYLHAPRAAANDAPPAPPAPAPCRPPPAAAGRLLRAPTSSATSRGAPSTHRRAPTRKPATSCTASHGTSATARRTPTRLRWRGTLRRRS